MKNKSSFRVEPLSGAVSAINENERHDQKPEIVMVDPRTPVDELEPLNPTGDFDERVRVLRKLIAICWLAENVREEDRFQSAFLRFMELSCIALPEAFSGMSFAKKAEILERMGISTTRQNIGKINIKFRDVLRIPSRAAKSDRARNVYKEAQKGAKHWRNRPDRPRKEKPVVAATGREPSQRDLFEGGSNE